MERLAPVGTPLCAADPGTAGAAEALDVREATGAAVQALVGLAGIGGVDPDEPWGPDGTAPRTPSARTTVRDASPGLRPAHRSARLESITRCYPSRLHTPAHRPAPWSLRTAPVPIGAGGVGWDRHALPPV